jgi:membrane-bound metal-dependent hydrolase YbcI (DUF457 family)
MPFTPFHFGPTATIGLLARKCIDLPVFVLVNVAIDVESLLVMLFGFNYPLHGYCHTFLIGSLVGAIFAILAYLSRRFILRIMTTISLPYETSFKKIFFSSLLGVWFHVLLDAPIYPDIRPFYPYSSNPLYGIVSLITMYLICSIFFIPAIFLYLRHTSLKQKRPNK